jgi:deoxyribodipyrimidine photolyase-related protein
MQNFATELVSKKHQVIYINLNDKNNLQSFEKNIQNLISEHNFTHFEYQLPDEYRVDLDLKKLCESISITSSVVDSEHFFTSRSELGDFFEGKKIYLMESFYRAMRKKYNVMMEEDKPLTGQWNYDGQPKKVT